MDELAANGAGPVELLDYLAAAAEREDGLTPGAVEPVPGRVQVLTVHAAKGLEWDIVALPHLCEGLFPAARTTTWLGEAGRLPPGVRGDRDDLPELILPAGGDQSEMVKALQTHVARLKSAQLDEERRLLYVALTRAREVLLLSAHHWGRTGLRPRGPGEFFTALREIPAAGTLEVDAPPPSTTVNPIVADPRTEQWPIDPLGARAPGPRGRCCRGAGPARPDGDGVPADRAGPAAGRPAGLARRRGDPARGTRLHGALGIRRRPPGRADACPVWSI